MQCEICKTTDALRWRQNICNSCYLKRWRLNNESKVLEYLKDTENRFKRSKRKAISRNIEWSLSLEEFSETCGQPCYYCDNLIGEIVLYNSGLDRLDNNKGYIKENVVSCCNTCNSIKSNILSLEEMKQVAQLIINLRK